MISNYTIIKNRIIPNKLISNKNVYSIILNNNMYIIDEFIIFTNKEKKIEKIIISKGKHPNCNPKTKEFCIPDFIKQIDKIDDKTLNIIENMMKVFNFNSAYYLPWDDFEMKEMR